MRGLDPWMAGLSSDLIREPAMMVHTSQLALDLIHSFLRLA
jgi:hypothetical protein